MSYFYNYTESTWVQNYKSSDQTWLLDSLNWDKLISTTYHDYSFAALICRSYFYNQHFFFQNATKLSFMDILLLNSTLKNYTLVGFYNYFIIDLYLSFNVRYLPDLSFFTSSNQDALVLSLVFAPEIIIAFSDYFLTYTSNYSTTIPTVSACFDSYLNNLDYSINEGLILFFLFFLFSWFFIYFFYTFFILKWSNMRWAQVLRLYLYSFSLSKDTRLQYETVLQTAIFFIFYWSMTIMSFDDDKEELIEYLDSVFFYFFSFILLYFFYKHSIHYFSFLEASATGSRSVMFLATQFKGDFLALFSMILRFYSLLLRLNVYDILDDCLDFYYIFIGDFDDDEYLQEMFFSLYGTFCFFLDNHDDRSFLLEDESDFFYDFYYIYFLLWGKIFYFLFYTVELTARFGLAFYVIYLVLFEIYGVNCSYREDSFFNIKR